MVADGRKDIVFALNGNLIVGAMHASKGSNLHVSVFGADGKPLPGWGPHGGEDNELISPSALALVGAKIFVLDLYTPRVQVFK